METQTETKTESKTEETAQKSKKKLLLIILLPVLAILLAVGGLLSWKSLFRGESQFDKNAKGQKVQPVVGATKTAKTIKSADGGTIQLEKSTLALEKDALPATKEITVAKIDSIGGMDSSWRYVSGVQLGPDGTELDKLSTLKMEIPASANKDEIMGFSYDAGGKDFHLYPMKVEGQTANFNLTGFSGYGILILKDQNKYPDKPSTIQAQAEQYIEAISVDSQKRTGGIDTDASRRIKNILLGWYKSSVKSQLKDAETDDSKLEAALSEMKAWLIFTHSYFADADVPEIEEAKNMAAIGVKNASEKASKACSTQKDPTQATKLMRYYKIAAGMLEGRGGLSSAKIQEMIKKCVNFELKINSKIEVTMGGVTTYVDASGAGHLAVGDNAKLTGSGEINVTRNQIADMIPCTSNVPETWKYNIPDTDLVASKESSKFSLQIDLSFPSNSLVYECGASIRKHVDDASVTDPNAAWDFYIYHMDEMLCEPNDVMNSYLLTDWQMGAPGSGVFATKKYDRTISPYPGVPVSVKENTTFELIHTPK